MKIEGISSLTTVPVSNLIRARVSEGAIALPVNSTSAVYSNFKHIKGIPAAVDGTGYSISRLRALDNLIDRLRGLGAEKTADYSPAPGGSEPPGIAELTASLRKELNEALSRRMIQFRGSAGLDTALSLDISA